MPHPLHASLAALALVLTTSAATEGQKEALAVVYIGGWEGARRVVGAGVVVERDRLRAIIATAGHVAAFEHAFVTTRTGRSRHRMRVLVRAVDADLALIETDVTDVAVATLAEPKEGERGSIIGHPYDLAWKREDARILGPSLVEDYEVRPTDIVASCPRCGPGDSGGAILNDRGHLLGIATAVFGQTTYGVDSCGIRALLRSFHAKRANAVSKACAAVHRWRGRERPSIP